MRDDFGIGLRLEGVAERTQLLALLFVVFDDAVVHQRHAVTDVRVRIGLGDPAMGGPAGVADAQRRAELLGLRRLRHLRHAPGAAHAAYLRAIEHGDAGGIIAAVLQTLQSFDQDRDHIAPGDRSDNAAHRTTLEDEAGHFSVSAIVRCMTMPGQRVRSSVRGHCGHWPQTSKSECIQRLGGWHTSCFIAVTPLSQPTMIRDTSAQDQVLRTPAQSAPWRRWLWPGIAVVAVLAGIGWAVTAWSAGSRSFDASRVRIATVSQGDLVRDIAADGRVIAANSPVLYAISAGTVTLSVVAGDVVKQGQEPGPHRQPGACAASWPRSRPPWPGWKPSPAAPPWTPPWPAPRPASSPIRPRSTSRPPRATWSATSAATMAARCRRWSWPRRRTP